MGSAEQDDAHIFCLPSQLTDEIRSTLDLVQKTMAAFNFTQLEVRAVSDGLDAAHACAAATWSRSAAQWQRAGGCSCVCGGCPG